MSGAAALGFAAGALALLGARELAVLVGGEVRARTPTLARTALLLARAGKDGRDPGAAERRRLLVAGSALAAVAGLLLAGPLLALAAAAGAPWVVAKLLRARRERHRAAVERGAPALAQALADALAGGHTVRGAVAEAALGLPGAVGVELRRLERELALGAATDDALAAMAARVGSHQIDTIVAALVMQRRSGGDLATLLRGTARAFEDEARLAGEVRAATAQARFTGVVVVLLPLGGGLLAELASPGFAGRLAGSFMTLWLVGVALVLQAIAAVAIRRLGRVRA